MSDNQNKQPSDSDAELERRIRRERKFSLEEALGRMAGPGAMKGASPITGLQQAVYEIQEYLDRHLVDTAGVLSVVLLRQVKESDVLLKSFEQPLFALAHYVRGLLDGDHALKELVRQADVEWGRVFDERPHFDREGCPPDADDPYTLQSVRSALVQLLEGLTAGKA
jgi:hypothetical protein